MNRGECLNLQASSGYLFYSSIFIFNLSIFLNYLFLILSKILSVHEFLFLILFLDNSLPHLFIQENMADRRPLTLSIDSQLSNISNDEYLTEMNLERRELFTTYRNPPMQF